MMLCHFNKLINKKMKSQYCMFKLIFLEINLCYLYIIYIYINHLKILFLLSSETKDIHEIQKRQN